MPADGADGVKSVESKQGVKQAMTLFALPAGAGAVPTGNVIINHEGFRLTSQYTPAPEREADRAQAHGGKR